MARVISPFEKVTVLQGDWTSPEYLRKLQVIVGEKATFSFCLLSCFTCRIIPLYVLPIFSAKNCISLFAFFVLPPSGWVSFVIFLTFSYFSLTEWRASRCIKYRAVQQQLKANPLFFSLLFMWQRPDLLKAGALTKKGTNDRERCQSNTQVFQRCKHMCACTKGRTGSLFRAST